MHDIQYHHQIVYHTLVLSGGSEKVLAFIGVLKELPEESWNRSKTIVGTSAGAMLGMMLAMRLALDKIETLIKEFVNELRQDNDAIEMLQSLLATWGAYDGTNIIGNFVRKILFESYGIVNCTFEEFVKRTGVDFIVPVCNLTVGSTEMISVQSHPEIDMVTTIAMTTCVPFLFKPIVFKGNMYVDGALFGDESIIQSRDGTSMDMTLVMNIDVVPCSNPTDVWQYAACILQNVIRQKINNARFDPKYNDRIHTISVSCESCHGISSKLITGVSPFHISSDDFEYWIGVGRAAGVSARLKYLRVAS